MNESLKPDHQTEVTKAEDIESTVESEVERPSQVSVEEFKVSGDALVAKVKELIHRGNVRRIILKNEEGHILLEIPLTIGVVGGAVGAVMFPLIAALGAIGALVAHLTLVIEKKE
ncbi:MAG: DUF4342 domain-containing protein [Cyanophyceae cyanobacterium]